MKINTWYFNFSKVIARFCGRPAVFVTAVGLIVVWIISGPLFDFSDTWQLAINTSTTIVTFLMVFVIQSTQNRDMEAVQVKLDELIRVTQGAHNALLDLEDMEEQQLDAFLSKYQLLAKLARKNIEQGLQDIDSPEA